MVCLLLAIVPIIAIGLAGAQLRLAWLTWQSREAHLLVLVGDSGMSPIHFRNDGQQDALIRSIELHGASRIQPFVGQWPGHAPEVPLAPVLRVELDWSALEQRGDELRFTHRFLEPRRVKGGEAFTVVVHIVRPRISGTHVYDGKMTVTYNEGKIATTNVAVPVIPPIGIHSSPEALLPLFDDMELNE